MIKEGVLKLLMWIICWASMWNLSLMWARSGVKYGKMYAASDMIDVIIHGKSAHRAHPDQGVDVICVAAES